MDIYITSQIGSCTEFMEAKKAPKSPVSIVISPLKVESADEKNLRVTNGCNMWTGCHNARCYYSAAARELPRVGGRLGAK